jgi:hypothetical protein
VIDSKRKNGGPGRDRTDDLFHAMEARSQLRHRPTVVPHHSRRPGSIRQTKGVAGRPTRKDFFLNNRIFFNIWNQLPEFSSCIQKEEGKL